MGKLSRSRRVANGVLGMLVLGALYAVAAPACGDEPTPEGWVNVRQTGASGSKFETTAATTAGAKEITVAEVGDFQVGQGVAVSRCNIRYLPVRMWGVGQAYFNAKKPGDSVEIRGYDGSAGGSWPTFVLDIAPGKAEFRWTDDLGRNWHPPVAITHDWQPLSGGVEVRLGQRDWESGYVIALGARDQLLSTIEKIEGKTLTLKDAANRSAKDAVVRHDDTAAIQAAIDRAVREKRNVFLPIGRYRLTRGVTIRDAASLVFQGQSAVDTLLDISDGEGTCLKLSGGLDVTVRNLRMVGFMGFDEADRAGNMLTKGAAGIWGMSFRPCNAMGIHDTQRVLVENCHASRMSMECFVAGGSSRGTVKPGRTYTQSTTYLRCSATDCARNGFNDVMCGSENTSILCCRIENVGGCSWEGASRFVKFIGNYVRNSGPVAIGNIDTGNRDKTFPDLGAGQHIVADNVFEGGVSYGGRTGGNAVGVSRGATQVIVRNNLFVNFNSSGVMASGWSDSTNYPAANMTIAGNIMDLTCIGQKPVRRMGVDVSCNDVIVADNQIYTRGQNDPLVTGIRITEPALQVNVHDNLIRNCGQGIVAERGQSRVSEVVDAQTFLRAPWPGGLPMERIRPGQCAGWSLVLTTGPHAKTVSILDGFDPETFRFKLRTSLEMKVGDRFHVFAPSMNWNLHNNMISGCQKPMVLGSYGSETSLVKDNTIVRGEATGVKAAVEVHGLFKLIGNHISGFDEKDSCAFWLQADPLGRAARCIYRDNLVQRCPHPIKESQKGLSDVAKPGVVVVE